MSIQIVYIVEWFQAFERFLGRWNDTISLSATVLSILISTIVMLVIYNSGNKLIQQYDIRYIEAIFYEAGEQYKNMINLAEVLDEIILSLKPDGSIVSNNNKNAFLIELWKLRQVANKNWVKLPLHKLEQHENIFDKYRTKKIHIGQVKVKCDDLENILKELNEQLNECYIVQKKIKKSIKDLWYFLDINDKNKERIKYIIRNSYSGKEFILELEHQQIKIKVEWKKVQHTYFNLLELIKNYIKAYKEAKNLLHNSKVIYGTNLEHFFGL